MVQIIPAILAKTKEDFESDLEKLTQSPSLEGGWLHIDFADNIFVANKTIEPADITGFPNNFKKEAHLMVQNPHEWVDKLLDLVDRIIIHIESDEALETVDYIKNKGIQVGVAININTPLERLDPYLGKIDLVLVMSIESGYQGQPFKKEALEKIKELKVKRDEAGLNFEIGDDGHINDENAKVIVEAGTDNLVIGSFLVRAEDVDENIEKIWEAINS